MAAARPFWGVGSRNPELTGRTFVEALNCIDIVFLKGFWNMPDNLPGAQQGGLLVSATTLGTNRVRQPRRPLEHRWSRVSRPRATPAHAACHALLDGHACGMPMGACNPMLRPIRAF